MSSKRASASLMLTNVHQTAMGVTVELDTSQFDGKDAFKFGFSAQTGGQLTAFLKMLRCELDSLIDCAEAYDWTQEGVAP